MSAELLTELDRLEDNPDAVFDRLESHYRETKNYHRLFDALLMRDRHRLGIPLVNPTSFDDVPADQRKTFEAKYIEAARTVGELFLEDGSMADAWAYFRTIREHEPIRAAFDKIQTPRELTDDSEALINVALYEGAHPVKGMEILLRTHGTCNTVTATDQVWGELDPEDRDGIARLLVRELHRDLLESLRREVQNRMTFAPPSESITELISGREWLFADGNYHIDISHLNATVRFARALDSDAPELKLALDLCEYGRHLDEPLRYPGDPPFEDFYTAHGHFLHAIAGGEENAEQIDAALAYFRKKLDDEPDESDRVLIASVLIDLAIKTGRVETALDWASEFAEPLQRYTGISYADLCQQTGRLDRLADHARRENDPLALTAAMLSPGANGSGTDAPTASTS